MCAITLETNSPSALLAKSLRRGAARHIVQQLEERLVNRKLKVGPETAAVCAWRCVEKGGLRLNELSRGD